MERRAEMCVSTLCHTLSTIAGRWPPTCRADYRAALALATTALFEAGVGGLFLEAISCVRPCAGKPSSSSSIKNASAPAGMFNHDRRFRTGHTEAYFRYCTEQCLASRE